MVRGRFGVRLGRFFASVCLLASSLAWGQAGTLVFTSATYSVDEQHGPGFVTVNVSRVGGTTGTISTQLTTSDGTATAPADYQSVNVTLTFLDGAIGPALIAIPVVKDSIPENNETFDVHLTGGAAGALNQATVTILESPGTLVFGSPTYSINEQTGATFVVIDVNRVGGSDGTVSTTFTTSDGTATAPADYQAQNVTLTFLDGAVGPATIAIPIVRDSVVEDNETFDVHLTGGVAGALNQATVTIVESPGTLEFTSATYSVVENAGFVVVNVTRVGGTDDVISTSLTTSDLSATAPADYQTESVTLTFLSGAVGPAAIAIPIVNDGVVEGNESFAVHLTGGRAGAVNQAIVTILDAAADVALTDSAPPTVTPGGVLAYTIGIANNGNIPAQTVVLTDPLPATATFVSLLQGSGPAFTCTTPAVGANGPVTCNIATLAVGASATFTLTVNISPAAFGLLTNTASATSATADSATGNNTAVATTTVGALLATTAPAPALSQLAAGVLLVLVLVTAFRSRRRGCDARAGIRRYRGPR